MEIKEFIFSLIETIAFLIIIQVVFRTKIQVTTYNTVTQFTTLNTASSGIDSILNHARHNKSVIAAMRTELGRITKVRSMCLFFLITYGFICIVWIKLTGDTLTPEVLGRLILGGVFLQVGLNQLLSFPTQEELAAVLEQLEEKADVGTKPDLFFMTSPLS
jgi:hypothetical protein